VFMPPLQMYRGECRDREVAIVDVSIDELELSLYPD